jgi:hypothetical protein
VFVFLRGIGLGSCIHWPYRGVFVGILRYWHDTSKAWVSPSPTRPTPWLLLPKPYGCDFVCHVFLFYKVLTKTAIFVFCLPHHENLRATSVNITSVVAVAENLLNCVRSEWRNLRHFKQFLRDVDTENGDELYYIEVRWLVRGRVLKRAYNLRLEMYGYDEEVRFWFLRWYHTKLK